jgi:hypothetical protein
MNDFVYFVLGRYKHPIANAHHHECTRGARLHGFG